MAKKKAAKKAKVASKPTKASTKKKTGVKSKSKVAPKKKVVSKTSKKVASKTGKKLVSKPDKKATAKPTKKAVAKPTKKAVAKPPVKAVVATKEKAKSSAPKVKDEGRILAESVVNGILEKKGQNVCWLDLRGIENAVCDYFIICEGNSNTQVEAIAESVEDIVKKETSQRPYRSEGWENALWILIDYINVVVHVFEKETRHFYNLESLWADAEEIKVKQ